MAPPLTKTKTPGVFKRGGRYVVVYRDPQGRQRKRFARTLAEARDLKAALRADVVRGEYRALSGVRFDGYAAEWIAGYAGRTARGFREASRDDYRRQLGLNADGSLTGGGACAFFGRLKLAEVEPRDVKRYAAELAGRGLAPGTVRLYLAPLKALFATAVEDGLIRANPAAGLRVARAQAPGDDERRARALSEEQFRALVVAVAPRYRLLVAFLGQTGLRISEALALRWQDVDLGRRRVRVSRSLVRGRVGEPKSRYARRDVPLSGVVARALWEARKEAGAADDAAVFAGVDRSEAWRAVKKAGAEVGVPWAGLHTLRHTCATLLFERGLNAKQVQAWLGHHAASFTLDTYIHLLPDALPEPAFFDALVAAVGPAGWATDGQLDVPQRAVTGAAR